MIYAQRHRIYPTKIQKVFFEKSFGCSRFVYNHFLSKNNEQYLKNKKSDNYNKNADSLLELKAEHEWLSEVGSQTLQQSLMHLDSAYSGFFKKKSRYPKFKKKSNHESFSLPQGCKVVGNRLSIPKCKHIKIVLDREIPEFKTVTISKTPDGKYYASFVIKNDVEFPPKPRLAESKTIGIDLGIKKFAILSNGERIENPKYLRKGLKRLAKEQKGLAKKLKGGENRRKQRIKVARAHQKVSNQRQDFLHKLTYELTHENQVTTICIEDLAVANMVKNHKLALSISDAGWGEFRRQLTYKCDWYGKNLVVIDRFAPSSKLCRHCGTLNDNLTLKDRFWTCDCGATIDRDLNAALNIREFGIRKYQDSAMAQARKIP